MQKSAVAGTILSGQYLLDVLLPEDALRQAVLVGGQRQLGGRVAGDVARAQTEPEQALDGGERADGRARRVPDRPESVRD